MGPARHVNRDAFAENREVGAVILVEVAKENLIGFATAMVLAPDQLGVSRRTSAGGLVDRSSRSRAARVCSEAAEVGYCPQTTTSTAAVESAASAILAARQIKSAVADRVTHRAKSFAPNIR